MLYVALQKEYILLLRNSRILLPELAEVLVNKASTKTPSFEPSLSLLHQFGH